MLNSTPEFVEAHLAELGNVPPKPGPEAIARYRAERRSKRSLLAATFEQLGFTAMPVRPTEPSPSSE